MVQEIEMTVLILIEQEYIQNLLKSKAIPAKRPEKNKIHFGEATDGGQRHNRHSMIVILLVKLIVILAILTFQHSSRPH